MLRNILNRVLLIVVALLVLAAIIYAFLPQPIEVETAAVTRGPLQVTVDEDGRTRIRERFVISAPLAGRMRRLDLDPGDAVGEGDLVVLIDPTDAALLDPRDRAAAQARVRAAAATVRQAVTRVAQAEAQVEFARSELSRIRQMFDRNAATPHERDQAVLNLRIRERELEVVEFGVEIARFELELAEAGLLRTDPDDEAADEQFEVRSPVAGRVLRVEQESEAVLTPGQAIMEIGDPRQMEIEIDVLSTDAVRIAPGAAALIEHWGGRGTLEAIVRRVEPQAFTHVSALGVEEQRVNIILDFASPAEQWERLGDGYRVEGRIVTWREDDVLKAPTSALFRHNAGWAVFRLVENEARMQPVTTGQSTGLETHILDGLAEGDIVIEHPSDRITDGAAVRHRQTGGSR